MKRILFVLISLISLTTLAKDNEIKLSSSIQEVTVFQQGAQITRVSRANIPVGTHALIFEGLYTGIDPNQLKVTGDGAFTILSMNHEYHTDTIAGWNGEEQRKKLQKQRALLSEEISRENGWLDIYAREENMLAQNQLFGTKEEGVDLDKLKAAADFVRQRYIDIREQRLAIQDRVAKLTAQIADIDLEYSQIPPIQTKQELRMIVRVSAKKAEVATFKLQYQVANAGWYAGYDARVASIDEPMQLDYNAFVYQTSGEDWDDIELVISTGTPRQNKNKPNLTPWQLGQTVVPTYQNPQPVHQPVYNNNQLNAGLQNAAWNPNVRQVTGVVMDQNGNALAGARVNLGGTNTVVSTNAYGQYSMTIPTGYGVLHYSHPNCTQLTFNASSNTMNVYLTNNQIEIQSKTIQIEEIQMAPAQLSEVLVTQDSYYSGNTLSTGGSLFSGNGRNRVKEEDLAQERFTFASVQVAYTPTQTQFKIDAKYSIPSTGAKYAVQVSRYDLEADYLYQCVPKIDPTAYLTARLTGWEDLNLLSGNMNVYFEDTYVGQSHLDLTYLEDTLNVSLGPDKNIHVKRKSIKSDQKDQMIAGKTKDTREWEIIVLNKKRSDINIRIEDQVPVSSNEEIEIEIDTISGGSVSEESGIVTWDFSIKTNKEKSFTLKYSVRYPKEFVVKL